MNKGGVQRFNGHLYWFSWQDNDGSVANAKWDWFNARNYCRSLSRYIYPDLCNIYNIYNIHRKRCMDLVSFETREEYDWVKGFINGEANKHILSSYIHQLHVCSECALLLDLWAPVRL